MYILKSTIKEPFIITTYVGFKHFFPRQNEFHNIINNMRGNFPTSAIASKQLISKFVFKILRYFINFKNISI